MSVSLEIPLLSRNIESLHGAVGMRKAIPVVEAGWKGEMIEEGVG